MKPSAATARLRMGDHERGRLKRLSPATKWAIKQAFVEWVETAQANDYDPIKDWRNFMPEVHHSALLDRILSGKKPRPVAPPTRYAYPDYAAVEDA